MKKDVGKKERKLSKQKPKFNFPKLFFSLIKFVVDFHELLRLHIKQIAHMSAMTTNDVKRGCGEGRVDRKGKDVCLGVVSLVVPIKKQPRVQAVLHVATASYVTTLLQVMRHSNLESTTSLVTLLDAIKQEQGMEVRTDATSCTPVECFSPFPPPSFTPTAVYVGLYKQSAAMLISAPQMRSSYQRVASPSQPPNIWDEREPISPFLNPVQLFV
uniref:Uncharacterized protein n=1 Tax=Timema poppense TaxID=170557 RepID=A0A7R9GVH1_TIMPO|nr:unnamed protein product [Timema poppensis]